MQIRMATQRDMSTYTSHVFSLSRARSNSFSSPLTLAEFSAIAVSEALARAPFHRPLGMIPLRSEFQKISRAPFHQSTWYDSLEERGNARFRLGAARLRRGCVWLKLHRWRETYGEGETQVRHGVREETDQGEHRYTG